MAAVRPQHTRTQACTRRHLSGIGCPVNMMMKGRKGGEEGNKVEGGVKRRWQRAEQDGRTTERKQRGEKCFVKG